MALLTQKKKNLDSLHVKAKAYEIINKQPPPNKSVMRPPVVVYLVRDMVMQVRQRDLGPLSRKGNNDKLEGTKN